MNILRLAVLLSGLFFQLVTAGTIMVATTHEPSTSFEPSGSDNVYDEVLQYVNLHSEFTVVDARRTLGSAAINQPRPSFSGHDLVIIVNAYYKLTDIELVELKEAIQQRKSEAFIIFSDGCCGDITPGGTLNSDNLSRLLGQAVDQNKFTNWTSFGYSNFLNANRQFETYSLNLTSPYKKSFEQNLQSFEGGAYRQIIGFPDKNVLYRDRKDGAVGIFIPRSESWDEGKGACTFAIADASPFIGSIYQNSNKNKMLAPFLDAATKKDGACALSSTGSYVTAASDSANTSVSKAVLIDALVNDETTNTNTDLTLQSTLIAPPQNGIVTLVNNQFSYMPNLGFDGEDRFTYRVKDVDGAFADATVTVTVRPKSKVTVTQSIPMLSSLGLLSLIGLFMTFFRKSKQ